MKRFVNTEYYCLDIPTQGYVCYELAVARTVLEQLFVQLYS